jgi:hypothetical protein
VGQNGLDFGSREDDRNVAVTFGPNDAVDFAEIAVQNVAEKEEERVKGLVLG